MISSIFSEECAYALMAEVGATPKPGLVDRHDSGAHTDMNYDTFAARHNGNRSLSDPDV